MLVRILVGLAVLELIGLFVGVSLVQREREQVQLAQALTRPALAEVVVARGNLHGGDALGVDDLGVVVRPAALIPTDGFATAEGLLGRTLRFDVPADDILRESMFTDGPRPEPTTVRASARGVTEWPAIVDLLGVGANGASCVVAEGLATTRGPEGWGGWVQLPRDLAGQVRAARKQGWKLHAVARPTDAASLPPDWQCSQQIAWPGSHR